MLEIRSIINPVIDMRDDHFEYFDSGTDFKNKTGLEPPYFPGKPCKMWRPKVTEADFQPMLIHRLAQGSWYSPDPPLDEDKKPLMESVFLTKGRAYFLNFWPEYTITYDAQKLDATEEPPCRKPLPNEWLYRSWFPGAPNAWANATMQEKQPVKDVDIDGDIQWIKNALTKIGEAVGVKL